MRKPEHDYGASATYFVTICTRNRECLLGEIHDDRMQVSRYGDIVDQEWWRIPDRFPSVRLDEYVIMPNHLHGIIVLTAPEPAVPGEATDRRTTRGVRSTRPGDAGDSQATHDLRAAGWAGASPAPTGTRDAADPGIPGAGDAVDPRTTDRLRSAGSGDAMDSQATHDLRAAGWAGASPAPTVSAVIGAFKSLADRACREAFIAQYPDRRFGRLWQRNFHDHVVMNPDDVDRIRRYIRENVANWATDKHRIHP